MTYRYRTRWTARDITRACRRGIAAFAVGCVALALGLSGCAPTKGNDLTKMDKAKLTINGHVFDVWIARTEDERERGLMFVTPDQLAPEEDGAERGMLFLFETQKPLSFWMKNTVTPLDIAFINSDKSIVATHTMKPLDESTYPSDRPAKYALEVRAQVFKTLGIRVGDAVVIPDDVLKTPR